jgi:hypothetical protein
LCARNWTLLPTTEGARGASALIAAARSARVLNTMSDSEARKAGVENRRAFIRIENGKANLAPPSDSQGDYAIQAFS